MEDLGEVVNDVAGLIHCLTVNEQTWNLTLAANLNEALTSRVICNDIMLGSSMLFCSMKDITLWQYGQVGL